MVLQKRAYWADSRRVERWVSFWMDSVKSVVGIEETSLRAEGKGMVEGGRRERQRLKAGEGKTVRALTRMLVTVSGWRRCGLNWYL
jgi:hypothetical protein